MSDLLHFEDFHAGQVFHFGTYRVTKEEIMEFAREFDPQPHHLDEDAANRSMLSGLSASGWHTSAMAMRLFVDGLLVRSAAMGAPGVEEGRWMKPVRPGNELRLEIEVLETRASTSRKQLGFVRFAWRLFNQREQVAFFISSPMFKRREIA